MKERAVSSAFIFSLFHVSFCLFRNNILIYVYHFPNKILKNPLQYSVSDMLHCS